MPVRETKNKHDRWVGFGERTAGAIRNYVERFRGDRPGELFLTAAGEPMASGNAVRVMLRRIAEQLGLEKVHPHRFRHTFATWAIQSGAREIDVQMLLGHSDLAMVQRYSRTYTSEQAVRAHLRSVPLDSSSRWPSRTTPGSTRERPSLSPRTRHSTCRLRQME